MLRARRLIGPLLAVVLLATGVLIVPAPAAGQSSADSVGLALVRITSAAAAGTYTVGWRTLGGCDPGEGTSGMSGEVTLTVEATGRPDGTPEPGELTGTPAVRDVVIRPICVYTWSVSFVEATTDANCIVGPAPFAPDDDNEINITLTDPATACAQQSRIIVRLHPAVPVAVDDTDHNAILRTRFTATAQRVKGAPRRCSTRTGVSEVDDMATPGDTTDDSVSIELRVAATTAAGEECRYDVTLKLPSYLVAAHGKHERNVFENVDPLATIDFRVGVATKTIFLLQTVVGDSRAANVRYELSRTCGDPDPLPANLLAMPRGGIQPIEQVTLVELREGRFNVTAALADDPSAEDAFDGVVTRVLDNRSEKCEATVSMSHLPDWCVAEETSITIDLTRAADPTIIEFEVTCSNEDEAPDADEGGGTGETA